MQFERNEPSCRLAQSLVQFYSIEPNRKFDHQWGHPWSAADALVGLLMK